VNPPPAARVSNRRLVVILFVLVMLYVTALTWKSEKDSCTRNAGVRGGFNSLTTQQGDFLTTQRTRALVTINDPVSTPEQVKASKEAVKAYDQLIAAQRPVRVLDCGGLFPDNQ
jgi:hypothetical protein